VSRRARVVQAPLALASDGTLLLNVAASHGPDDSKGLLERALAEGRAIHHWPHRTPTARPASVPQGHWSRTQWSRVVNEVREARVPWDDVGLCFSRFGERAAPTKSGRARITVSLLPYWGDSRGRGKTLFVFASVYDTTETLPPGVARAFRRVLQKAGFEPNGARSVRDGKRLPGRVGFDKKVKTESGAVETCLRIYSTLMEVAVP
jgi:hypothetical protein